MALLELRDVGKIYVNEGNVSVGIRGVNLTFDRGEFVAVTGTSGSGKSTLLNVISGIDTYEEGELLINGETTSHYSTSEWEQYRQKYVSFIFQDYNIIECFTVLQNVELALMHIRDKKERRRRALELIDRVGMTKYLRQKGSQLSGGQKQRTVIARALAKDSPMILADEPTGNLDSASSKEIINLLREVSRDKLLIIVTHNFDQVADIATREIRVFDGAVESDHVLAPNRIGDDHSAQSAAPAEETKTQSAKTRAKRAKSRTDKSRRDLRNGIALGNAIFTSRPKLSVFMCLLLIIASLGIFATTASNGEMSDLFDKRYMFSPIDGRVVFTKGDGAAISEDELAAIAKKYGATSYTKYDLLLDVEAEFEYYRSIVPDVTLTFDADFGSGVIGSSPQKANEVLLNLPVSLKDKFGTDKDNLPNILMFKTVWTVVGVHYYSDNTVSPSVSFTREGFDIASKLFLASGGRYSYGGFYAQTENQNYYFDYDDVNFGFFDDCDAYVNAQYPEKYDWYLNFGAYSFDMDFNTNEEFDGKNVKKLDTEVWGKVYDGFMSPGAIVSVDCITKLVDEFLDENYSQASLFFANDRQADAAVDKMCADGYIAVSSKTEYEPSMLEILETLFTSVLALVVWGISVIFLAFFINLCTAKAFSAFKADAGIMRSMGISVKVIKTGMYVRMLLSMIPSIIVLAVAAALLSFVPSVNRALTSLQPWHYILIVVGTLLVTLRVVKKQLSALFGESVKSTLGGNNE